MIKDPALHPWYSFLEILRKLDSAETRSSKTRTQRKILSPIKDCMSITIENQYIIELILQPSKILDFCYPYKALEILFVTVQFIKLQSQKVLHTKRTFTNLNSHCWSPSVTTDWLDTVAEVESWAQVRRNTERIRDGYDSSLHDAACSGDWSCVKPHRFAKCLLLLNLIFKLSNHDEFLPKYLFFFVLQFDPKVFFTSSCRPKWPRPWREFEIDSFQSDS